MATIQKHKGLDLVNLNKLFTEMKRNEDYDDISKDDKQNDRRHFLPILQGKKPFSIGTINHSSNFIEGFQELLDKIERLQSQKDEYIKTKKKNIFLNEKLTEINDLIEATRHHRVIHDSLLSCNRHLPKKQLEKEEHDKYNKVIKLSEILLHLKHSEERADDKCKKLEKEYQEKRIQLEEYHKSSERNEHLECIRKLEFKLKVEKDLKEKMKQHYENIINDYKEEMIKVKEKADENYPIELQVKHIDEKKAIEKRFKKKCETEIEKEVEKAEKDIETKLKKKYEDEIKQLKKDKKELQLKLFNMEHQED